MDFIFLIIALSLLLVYFALIGIMLCLQKKNEQITFDDISLLSPSDINSAIQKTNNLFHCSFDARTNTIKSLCEIDEINNSVSAAVLLHEYCHYLDFQKNRNNYRENKFFDISTIGFNCVTPLLFLYALLRCFYYTFQVSIVELVIVMSLVILLALQFVYYFFRIVFREIRVFMHSLKIVNRNSIGRRVKRMFYINFFVLLIERLFMLSILLFISSVFCF